MEGNFGRPPMQNNIIKVLKQSGKFIDKKRDASRTAMLPGKRISRTGKVYWETRANRTDAPLKNI